MCKFKSAVVTKEGNVYHHDLTNSHAQIQLLYNLKDRGEDIACVEFSPSGPEDDLASYALYLDQVRTPSWWTEDFAAIIAEKMKAIVSSYIIVGDVPLALGRRIIVRNGRILEARHSIVTAYDSSKVTACDSSKVTAYDSSEVTAYGSSKVTAYGSSEVTAYDSSKVTDKRVKS